MEKTIYYGTASGDVSRYTEKGIIEHYIAADREFRPSTINDTVHDLDTNMRSISQQEAEVIMERSSKIADKLANAG